MINDDVLPSVTLEANLSFTEKYVWIIMVIH